MSNGRKHNVAPLKTVVAEWDTSDTTGCVRAVNQLWGRASIQIAYPYGVLQGRRGWKSEFAKPYKPLGVPNLDIAPPTNILRQRGNSQKSFGTQGMKLLPQFVTNACYSFVCVTASVIASTHIKPVYATLEDCGCINM